MVLRRVQSAVPPWQGLIGLTWDYTLCCPLFVHPSSMKTLRHSLFCSHRYDKMDSAIDTLTENLENGDYFRQVNPKDFDAEIFFARFDNRRRARAIWTKTVIPRLISSKHSALRGAGVALQRKWRSKPYRKQLNQVLGQEKIILDSVHKHQTRILEHSYEDLCYTLRRCEGIIFDSFLKC